LPVSHSSHASIGGSIAPSCHQKKLSDQIKRSVPRKVTSPWGLHPPLREGSLRPF
jgi:hypothetical protein